MAVTIKANKSLATAAFDDGILINCKNGAPARGPVMQVLADTVTARQSHGRPFFHFWGGRDNVGSQPNSALLHVLRLNTLEGGCKSPRGIVHVLPTGSGVSSTAGIYCLDGTLNAYAYGGVTSSNPEQVVQIGIAPDTTADTSVPTGEADEHTLGSDSLYLASGCLFEDSVPFADPTYVVSRYGFAPGSDIIASQTGSISTTHKLVDRFTHVWQNRRPQIGWACADVEYTEFTTSSQAFRYIFDQTIGTGGTAPSNTGPGLTLPVRYAGAGLRETIRVYVWVRAAMSGATDHGEIAIANKNTSGVMSSFIQIGGAGMISGTTPTWYPATGSTFNPATAPYFESPTNQAFDRVLLGARSTGATNKVRISGFMMAVYHSVA